MLYEVITLTKIMFPTSNFPTPYYDVHIRFVWFFLLKYFAKNTDGRLKCNPFSRGENFMMYVKNLLVFTVCFSLAFPAWAGESFFQKIFIDPMVDMVTSSTEQEKLQDELDKTNEQIKETQEEIVKTEKALKKESSRKKKDAEEIEELESTRNNFV